MSITESIVLITSSSSNDRNKNPFGTGFVVYRNDKETYLLTCAHVVRDVGGKDTVLAGGITASVVVSGEDKGFDLAVLRVECDLDLPVLKLIPGREGTSFIVSGCYDFDGKNTRLLREIQGCFGKKINILSTDGKDRIEAWDLHIEDEDVLQPGYSGSPVVEKASGAVVAIVSHQVGKGDKGLGIAIESLKKIWSEMPFNLEQRNASPLETKVVGLGAIPSVPVWKGRDELLNNLKTKLLRPENPPKVLALIGQGGIGKTSLAVKLLEALGVNLLSRTVTTDCPYQCAMYFKADVGTSFDEVADFLLIDGLDFQMVEPFKAADEKIAKIIAGLTETRCLLVLDNLESILQPANDCSAAVSPTAEMPSPQAHRAISQDWGKLLNALVYQQHQSQTILTSREVPADLADTRYEGLEPDSELVQIERLAGVSADAGVEILQQRQLQDKESDLQWVSERVDGHVFLLTQLAAIGKGKPGYLRKHPEFVTKKAEPILREQLERQSEAARDLLRRMCVLRVGIDVRGLTFLRLYRDDWEKNIRFEMAANQNKAIEFTEAEITETEVVVERLVNSSLVQSRFDQDKCENLYDLQQVIAEFMRQDYEQLPSLFKRVDLFYSSNITFEDIKKDMSALERFKQATIFALNVGDEREHLRLVKLMLNYHFRLGSGNFIENALMQHPNVVEGNNQAKILLLFGSSHYEIGNWEEAKRCFETALATAQAEGKREEVARAIGWLSCIERDCGNWEEAERLYRQCTLEEAERLYRQCLEIQTELGDRSGMATSILCLGEIEMLRGNLDAAEPLIKDAMTQLQKLGKTHKIGYSYYDLARLERKRSNEELAQQHYNTAHQIFQQLGAAKDLERIEREWHADTQD